jgi:hypothetical protein
MNVLKLIILAIISQCVAAWGKAPSTSGQLKYNIQKISQKDVVNLVSDFVSESSPSRMVGRDGHTKAKDFILKNISALDGKKSGKVIVDTYSPDIEEAERFYQSDFDQKVLGRFPPSDPNYQKWFRFTSHMKQTAQKLKVIQGANITWEKTGLDSSKVLVISAHYDTISHDTKSLLIAEKDPMPGANYNASGVAIALSLIKILSEIDLNYTVQVTFLDWQGIGFLGSHRYAQELKKTGKNILGFINLEMLGQDSRFFDKTKKSGNMSVYCRPADQKFIQSLNTHGARITSQVTFEIKPIGFENSDNFRFWENGIQGGTYSQNWEDDFNPKFFQTPQDTPETLNHQTLYASYEFLAGSVGGILLDLTK